MSSLVSEVLQNKQSCLVREALQDMHLGDRDMATWQADFEDLGVDEGQEDSVSHGFPSTLRVQGALYQYMSASHVGRITADIGAEDRVVLGAVSSKMPLRSGARYRGPSVPPQFIIVERHPFVQPVLYVRRDGPAVNPKNTAAGEERPAGKKGEAAGETKKAGGETERAGGKNKEDAEKTMRAKGEAEPHMRRRQVYL